jgi:CobQ-like glutamine amidotransferase family enzyme
MKIEILYPEICYLFGDLMNIEYLHRCLPEAELIKTSLKAPPAFASGGVDMVCLCSMTEKAQELAAEALRPYQGKLEELINSGTVFLVTGNAMEVFGRYIENEDGSKLKMLGMFDLYAKRSMMNRYNSLYLGKFEDIDIVGFKSQFAHSYGESGAEGLFETVRGAGRNPQVKPEGIRKNNFMATYLLGPLLILNPPFTKYIMQLLGVNDRPLSFEAAAMDSYHLRLKEFSDPKRGFDY